VSVDVTENAALNATRAVNASLGSNLRRAKMVSLFSKQPETCE